MQAAGNVLLYETQSETQFDRTGDGGRAIGTQTNKTRMRALFSASCCNVLYGSKGFFVGGNIWMILKYQNFKQIVKLGTTFSVES